MTGNVNIDVKISKETFKKFRDVLDNQSWIYTVYYHNNYFKKIFKEVQQKEEEQFKQEYMCDWINYNPNIFTKELSGFWIEPNKIKVEEKEEMTNFQLGDILVGKDAVADFMDGEAILIAPGYKQEDFDVNKTDKGVQVTAYRECGDCGDIMTKEFSFDFNPYRKVEDVKYNVRDGIFILQVAYAVGSNVEIDENL